MPRKTESSQNILAIAGPNSKYNVSDANPAGFWAGLWHGIIAGITFLISLFAPGVKMYETNNNGGWYDFGFLLGIGTFSSCRIFRW